VHACTCDFDVSDVTVEAVVHSLRSTSKLDNLANSDDKACVNIVSLIDWISDTLSQGYLCVDIVYPHVAFQASQCI